MIRWNNDYNKGAHPQILKALEENNNTSYPGYGLDEWCDRAASEIKKYLKNDKAQIHFMLGGTQVNYTIAAAALRPYQGIICADTAHIHVHETGAVENTGHKILALKAVNGKLTAKAVKAEAENYRESDLKEHITQPKLVFLSNPSEYGTIYSLKELKDIRAVCDEYGMYMYMDGARLGYGLGSKDCDYTLSDLADILDAFYIGGTKCGAFFGEAVILINDDLKDHFRSYIKQNGALLAKGWLLGMQFYTLFKDGLYFDITKAADEAAGKIKEAFVKKNVPLYYENNTNQQFVILNDRQIEQLAKDHIFEFEGKYDEDRTIVRFCTSFATVQEDVDRLAEDIAALAEAD